MQQPNISEAGSASGEAEGGAVAKTSADLRKPSVLFYGMNYAPEFTGVGRYSGEIGADLAARGFDVRVVTTPPHYPGWAVHDGYRNGRYQVERLDGVKVLRCPLLLRREMKGVWRLLAPLSFAVSSAPVVVWQIFRHRPDVVICVEPTLFASPVATLAARLTGAKTALHVQDLEVDAAFAVGHLGSKPWLRRLGTRFERWALRGFDRIITISNAMQDRLYGKGVPRERLSIVRNWVDLDQVRPLDGLNAYRGELGIPEDSFIVQYAGNIGGKQALYVLLEAAERLKQRSDILFLIAGEGPEKARLQTRYGALPNVRFIGFQPEARLCEFLNLADLHALPQEAGAADLVLPSKLAGMLASGKPIVVTAGPETELGAFLQGAALIVPPGDSAALADAIEAARSAAPDAVLREKRLALAGLLSKQDALDAFAALLNGGADQKAR